MNELKSFKKDDKDDDNDDDDEDDVFSIDVEAELRKQVSISSTCLQAAFTPPDPESAKSCLT